MQPQNDKKNQKTRYARGWAGKNPQTYHSLIAVFNYLVTTIGFIVVGHYAALYWSQPWILWLAIGWGVFGNLFVLTKRLQKLERDYADDKKSS